MPAMKNLKVSAELADRANALAASISKSSGKPVEACLDRIVRNGVGRLETLTTFNANKKKAKPATKRAAPKKAAPKKAAPKAKAKAKAKGRKSATKPAPRKAVAKKAAPKKAVAKKALRRPKAKPAASAASAA